MFKVFLRILFALLLVTSCLSASDGLGNAEEYAKNSTLQSKWAMESLNNLSLRKTIRFLMWDVEMVLLQKRLQPKYL